MYLCVLRGDTTSPDLAGVGLFAHLDLPFPSSWKVAWERSGEGYKGKEISLGNSTYGKNLCLAVFSHIMVLRPPLSIHLWNTQSLLHACTDTEPQAQGRMGTNSCPLKPSGDKFYSSCEPITELYHFQQDVLIRDSFACLVLPTAELEQFQIMFFYGRSQIWSQIYSQDTGDVKGPWCLIFCGFMYCI